jgi:hypothetical protein
MKKIFTSLAFGIVLLSVPFFVSAQSISGGFENLGGVINVFTKTVVQALAYLMLTSAVTAFFFGIVQYIWGLRQGDAAKTKVGNNFMLWGLVALFVMFSVWGIIRFAQRTFGVTDTSITIPNVKFGETTTGGQPNPSAALPNYGTPAPTQRANCVSSNGLAGVYVGTVCQPTGDQ